MNWSTRLDQPEWLDQPGIPFDAIRKNMAELAVINRWLGGHAISVQACRKLVGALPAFSIAEIGSGGGDNLAAIADWARQNHKSMTGTGVDLQENCVQYARARFPGMAFINSDYRELQFAQQPDIIFSSLFCHHFSSAELVQQLQWMYRQSRLGFFINDLHRHPLAYHSIKILTSLFSGSELVKHDAPLSVQRAFSRADWANILSQAGIAEAELHWKWAFRWCVLVKKIG